MMMETADTGVNFRPAVKIGHEPNICAPIRSVSELWGFADNPPPWVKDIKEIRERSPTVVNNKHTVCHHVDGSTINIPKRLDADLVPRTLVCHDMKNGYLQDRFIEPVKMGNGYTFFRWSQIDMFVYFSHHFITIPPLGWINVAHSNGVKILGTFITEWEEGKKICNDFLKDVETMRYFANALADVTVTFKLDGWLLNIENSLDDTSVLVEFIKYLTTETHKKRPGSKIIWYDSVISDGTLKWQNELNEKNRVFFDVCDGIFLNYTWKVENLLTSSKVAQHRQADVYVGIDVFGRNTFGGGKFNCHIAAEKIRQMNMSMAVFAPGWTHETINKSPEANFMERFVSRDNAFWRNLWPFLYTHPVNESFDTFFYIGADKEYFKLSNQQIQLSRIVHSDLHLEQETEPENAQSKECNCLQLHASPTNNKFACLLTKNQDTVPYVHNLFYCDIKVEGDAVLYSLTTKAEREKNDFLNLNLLIQENGSFRKIVCCAVRGRKKANTFSVEYVYPCPDNRVVNFDEEDDVPKDGNLRCYHLKFKSNSRILEITGEMLNANSVILYGLGIKNIRFN